MTFACIFVSKLLGGHGVQQDWIFPFMLGIVACFLGFWWGVFRDAASARVTPPARSPCAS